MPSAGEDRRFSHTRYPHFPPPEEWHFAQRSQKGRGRLRGRAEGRRESAEERAAEEAEAQAKAEAERTAEEQALLDALRNEQIAALSRQLTVIDTQLADLYNKGSIDEALTSSRANVAAQLKDLGVTVAEPNWDEYMDKLNNPEEV